MNQGGSSVVIDDAEALQACDVRCLLNLLKPKQSSLGLLLVSHAVQPARSCGSVSSATRRRDRCGGREEEVRGSKDWYRNALILCEENRNADDAVHNLTAVICMRDLLEVLQQHGHQLRRRKRALLVAQRHLRASDAVRAFCQTVHRTWDDVFLEILILEVPPDQGLRAGHSVLRVADPLRQPLLANEALLGSKGDDRGCAALRGLVRNNVHSFPPCNRDNAVVRTQVNTKYRTSRRTPGHRETCANAGAQESNTSHPLAIRERHLCQVCDYHQPGPDPNVSLSELTGYQNSRENTTLRMTVLVWYPASESQDPRVDCGGVLCEIF